MSLKSLPLLVLGLFLSSVTTAIAATCRISQSIYRDVNRKGFELIFGPGLPNQANSYASAAIRHPRQRELYRFSVTQASGYGSITLLIPNEPDNQGFRINFFDASLKSASPGILGRETNSPKYAFIADLGSFDYYRRRAQISSDTSLIGDTLWVFDRCQSAAL